jgi:23S rRNA (adenine2503-C2)-methyltransferase
MMSHSLGQKTNINFSSLAWIGPWQKAYGQGKPEHDRSRLPETAVGKGVLGLDALAQITESKPESVSFLGLTIDDAGQLCVKSGASPMHARDLFRAVYKDNQLKPWERPGIPKKLASDLANGFQLTNLRIHSENQSRYDSSVKFLVELEDKSQIEMVLMPEAKRITLCVSSQVGCAQACIFCHTGRMGLKRNLSAAEIVGQVWLANHWISTHGDWLLKLGLPAHQKISNIVFMGMGEPLDNPEAVGKAISILIDPFGYNLAKRKISVSTAGHMDGLDRLLRLHPDVRLAISVHSAFDHERSKIMPINRRWPLTDLIAKLKDLPTHKENGLLLQYTLIAGVNDSIEHARELIRLVDGMNVKINLIPLNPVGPSRLSSPNVDRLEAFRDEIYRAGHRVMVRYSKGQDIGGACGQLVVSQKDA